MLSGSPGEGRTGEPTDPDEGVEQSPVFGSAVFCTRPPTLYLEWSPIEVESNENIRTAQKATGNVFCMSAGSLAVNRSIFATESLSTTYLRTNPLS